MRAMLRLLPLFLALSAALAEDAPPPQPIVVTLPRGADPAALPALQAMLSPNADRLSGAWPYLPPSGTPTGITKQDYLKAFMPYAELWEPRFRTVPEGGDREVYSVLPVLVAAWKATGEQKYYDAAVNYIKAFCVSETDFARQMNEKMEKEGRPGGRADIGAYWCWPYAYLIVPLEALAGTPKYQECCDEVGRALGFRANSWAIYWERGPHNRPMDAALWYDIALKYNPAIPRAKELKAYADMIWDDWWKFRDIEEDDSGYASGDLVVLESWCRVRGVKWWEDQDVCKLFAGYAEQIANDGTWPAYGGGGGGSAPWEYVNAMIIGELAATRLREGRYKWLAHRAYWAGRDRFPQFEAGLGANCGPKVAFAYLLADDTVQEAPPRAGLTLTQRRLRKRADPWPTVVDDMVQPFWPLSQEWQPNKLIFRGGPTERDDFLLLQAANAAGHGHPDSGSVIFYGANQAFYLLTTAGRLDDGMDTHDEFMLVDPQRGDKFWSPIESSEGTAVPVHGQASSASYARLRIQEYPGTAVTEEAWQRNLKSGGEGMPPAAAIGYKNWPVRLDRCVLFVNNEFAVVRDVVNPSLAFEAQMGQNWCVGEIGPTVGTNWVNTWMPKKIFGRIIGQLQPMTSAPRDLLIWFAPRADAALELTDRSRVLSWGEAPLNLGRRVWFPATGRWEPGRPQAFTTVLLPHDPVADPATLAGGLSALKDTPQTTLLQVKDGETTRTIVLNTGGQAVAVGDWRLNAEAALITSVGGKPSHLSAWHATSITLKGKALLASREPRDLDTAVK